MTATNKVETIVFIDSGVELRCGRATDSWDKEQLRWTVLLSGNGGQYYVKVTVDLVTFR